jgi:hypothetical protein
MVDTGSSRVENADRLSALEDERRSGVSLVAAPTSRPRRTRAERAPRQHACAGDGSDVQDALGGDRRRDPRGALRLVDTHPMRCFSGIYIHALPVRVARVPHVAGRRGRPTPFEAVQGDSPGDTRRRLRVPSRRRGDHPSACVDAFGDAADAAQHATHTVTYGFTDAPPRDGDSVGLDLAGRAMLVPAEKFKALVKKIGDTYGIDVE